VVAASVDINSGTLVVRLSDNANKYVIADAVRIELLSPIGPDTTAPSADLVNPADGDSIDPAVLNAQGYLEVSFADVGDGLDSDSFDGDELSLSGTGLGSATLSGGAPTLVSGTTYRYGFTGDFIEGVVNVEFVAGSFADLAATPNLNTAETENFTVTTPPPAPTIQIIDNGDAGYATVGSWSNYAGPGYSADIEYSAAGNGSDVASWTFTGLAAGSYEVSVTWKKNTNRASNAPFTIFDNNTQVGTTILINQKLMPIADHVEEGLNFQVVAASVDINSGTLVVRLSDNANKYVIADAVRIEKLKPQAPLAESKISTVLIETSATDSYSSALSSHPRQASGSPEDTNSDDGMADHEDLFPDNPELATLSDYINYIADYIADDNVIFAEDWKQSGNDADFVTKFESVLELVLAAEQAQDAEWAALLYQEALVIVDDRLIPKADGFHGGALEDDWIIVEEAQDIIYPDLLSLSEYLSLILQ
jgi:hypothetical protein